MQNRTRFPLRILALLAAAVFAFSGCAQPPAPTEPTTTATPTLPPPDPNPYGPTDFQYDGFYLKCLAGPSVLGIDVSSHQQEIDWEAVAGAGIEFVMIRAGFRRYMTGELCLDTRAQENYAGAKAAGLKVGAYLYAQAVSVEEALEEADFFLNAISGWELDMPVVYDWEYVSEEARTGQMDARAVTDCTIAFCEAVEARGYRPMVYFNRHQAQDLMYLEELTDYPFWLAMYSDRMTYPYQVDMWQYTSTGRVPGIEGNVDIDLWFPATVLDLDALFPEVTVSSGQYFPNAFTAAP